jgi:hypothetical protein
VAWSAPIDCPTRSVYRVPVQIPCCRISSLCGRLYVCLLVREARGEEVGHMIARAQKAERVAFSIYRIPHAIMPRSTLHDCRTLCHVSYHSHAASLLRQSVTRQSARGPGGMEGDVNNPGGGGGLRKGVKGAPGLWDGRSGRPAVKGLRVPSRRCFLDGWKKYVTGCRHVWM